MKQSKYEKTVAKLAARLGITREHLTRRYLHAEGNPGCTSRGYDVEKWLAFIAADRKRAINGTGSIRDRKTMVEIEILEAKRDEIRGRLVPVEHFRHQVETVALLSLSLWQSAIDAIAAKRKDARLLDELNAAMNNARERILETVETDTPRTTTYEGEDQ